MKCVWELCSTQRTKRQKSIHEFGVETSACSRIFAQQSGENKGVQANKNTHAATALPTFTLSGSRISHSMKYAQNKLQVARQLIKHNNLRHRNEFREK